MDSDDEAQPKKNSTQKNISAGKQGIIRKLKSYQSSSIQCPSVTQDMGSPILKQSRWIETLRKLSGDLAVECQTMEQ